MICSVSVIVPSGLITALRWAYQLNSQGLRVITTASGGRLAAAQRPAVAKLLGSALLAACAPIALIMGANKPTTASGRISRAAPPRGAAPALATAAGVSLGLR